MKPPPFVYHDPRTIDDAVALLAEKDNAKLLAGGQSLMPMLNMRFLLPDDVIDINDWLMKFGRLIHLVATLDFIGQFMELGKLINSHGVVIGIAGRPMTNRVVQLSSFTAPLVLTLNSQNHGTHSEQRSRYRGK